MAITSTATVQDISDALEHIYLSDDEGRVWTDKAKYHAIRHALLDIQGLVAMYSPSILMAQSTITFVAGTVEYALPTDFWRPIRLTLTNNTIVDNVPIIDYADDTNESFYAYIREGFIGIRATNPSGTLQLDYIKSLALPTTLAATLSLPDRWFPLLTQRAAIKLLGARGINTSALEADYTNTLSELQMTERVRTVDSAERYLNNPQGEHY